MTSFKYQDGKYFRKACRLIRLSGLKSSKTARYFHVIFILIIISMQVSCGLIYVENTKKINSSQNPSDTLSLSENPDSGLVISFDTNTSSSGSTENSASSTGNSYENGFENYNYTDSSYTVSKVIDGDTIELENKMRIRLIGINTSEKDMYFFEEAKVFMEILVFGKQVKLEKDVTDKDIYGRYLRYVYLPDIFVNLEMVKSGFANAYTYPPDVKYADKFIEAEGSARANEAGLWQKSPTEILEVALNYDAAGKDNENLNGEWVEIKNTGLKTLNLKDWTLKDSGTNIYKFGSCKLEPGKTVYLYTGKGTDTYSKLYWDSSLPVWNNDHDTLYIRDNSGLLVCLFNY